MSHVLVLNKQGLPISTVKWTRAIKLWLRNKAEVLYEYEDKYLHTFDGAMNMPSVIRLVHFIKPPHKVSRYLPFNRKNVWERDDGKCQYCGIPVTKKEFTYDHVIPRSKGGKNRFDNVVCCCFPCNSKKANRTPEEAGMKLIRKPFYPPLPFKKEREIVLGVKNLRNIPDERWRQFIYWNVELEED